jgi:hypothetical protein
MKTITRDFLASKVNQNQHWKAHGVNIKPLTDTIFCFTQHNFLGGKNEHGLDGHYTFVFDILNFNYVYWKYAGYAGLTSVDLVKKPLIISEPHESVKTMIDSFVAEQILQCCFYDSNATWNRGEFLIPKINE